MLRSLNTHQGSGLYFFRLSLSSNYTKSLHTFNTRFRKNSNFLDKIKQTILIWRDKMKITVAGAGNVGLVTAVCLADAGHQVTCVDTQKEKIEMLRKRTFSIL